MPATNRASNIKSHPVTEVMIEGVKLERILESFSLYHYIASRIVQGMRRELEGKKRGVFIRTVLENQVHDRVNP